MSWWQSRTGVEINGSAENAFVGDFRIIPNNTTARAQIKKFELITTNRGKLYQVQWQLMDGEFKGRILKQNIAVFDEDEKKSDRAKNMMMRIYNLCNNKPSHGGEPTNQDLMPMINKLLGIKIREMHSVKEDGSPVTNNWVSEVHPLNDEWQTMTGDHIEPPVMVSHSLESAFSRNPRGEPKGIMQDDIPF